MRRDCVMAMALAAAALGSAAGQVTDYEIFRTQVFRQTGAGSVEFQFLNTSARLLGSGLASQFDTATITTPGGEEFDLVVSPSGFDAIFFSPAFASLGDLEAQFPTGVYEFRLSGGALDGSFGTVDVPADDLFAVAAPIVENFSALSEFDPSAGLSVLLNGLEPNDLLQAEFDSGNPDAFAGTFVSIVDVQSGAVVLTDFLALGSDEFQISGGVLEESREYLLSVAYSSRITTEFDGLGAGSRGTSSFDLFTDVVFTTVPAVPAVAVPAAAGVFAARRRR